MTDKQRWREHDSEPLRAAVDSAVVIDIGDLLYLATDDARPASSQADQGSEITNQRLFADNFLGVAAQRSRSGDTNLIRVATDGHFEFVCPSQTWEIGDLIAADENADGDGLLDQQVTKTTDRTAAIGVCWRRQASATTTVLVKLLSTVMHGGPQGQSGV